MERCKEVTKTSTNPNGMKISDISYLLRNEIDDKYKVLKNHIGRIRSNQIKYGKRK